MYNVDIMRSLIRRRSYLAMYRLLNYVSPVSWDCGVLCGSVCCCVGNEDSSWEGDFDLGIYLLPGEEKVFNRNESWLEWSVENAEDFDFPDSWHGKVYFIRCNCAPHCPREMRPLQCRFFPLAPHFTEKGELSLIYADMELPYSCPLIEEKWTLTDSFIKATYTVWKHLIRDPLIYDLVAFDSSFRSDDECDFVYIGKEALPKR